MKQFTTLLILSLLFLQANAQQDGTSILSDSVITKKTIAVVPFMPQMYFNDLSRLWYKTGESHCQEKQINEISKNLAEALADSLITEYNLIDLNNSQTISTTDYLLEYYLLCNFAFADTFPQTKSKLKWAKNKLKKKENTKDKDFQHKELHSEKKEVTHQYLHVKIRDIKKYKKLCRDMGVDEVLFINQFDVKGDFSSPYNLGRETDYFINIHYSLFDKNGNLLLGNKTKYATTNEKARYYYFLSHDLRKACSEITKEISNLSKLTTKSESKKKKKAVSL